MTAMLRSEKSDFPAFLDGLLIGPVSIKMSGGNELSPLRDASRVLDGIVLPICAG